MSRNRENVIWQSPDGTWNRGFFDFVVTGPDDEWDVEYNHHAFTWAATGLASEDAARSAWHGANPGGYQRVPWIAANRAEIERYEKLARDLNDREHAAPSRGRRKTRGQLDQEIREVLAKKKPYSW